MCGLFVGVSWYDTIAELTRHPDLQVNGANQSVIIFFYRKLGFLQHHGNDSMISGVKGFNIHVFFSDRSPGVPGEGSFWHKVSFACKLHFGGYGSM